MAYQIGKFSNFLGVTPDWLKYYEKIDLLQPEISSTGYRFYSFEQASYVIFCMQLKNQNFTNVEIKELLNGTFADYVRAVGQKNESTMKQITFNNALAAHCRYLCETAPLFEDRNTWQIVRTKGFYFLPFSNRKIFIDNPETSSRMHEWNKFLPIVTQTQKIFIPKDYQTGDYPGPAKNQWGMSVQKEFAENMGLNIQHPAVYVPPSRCVEFYCKTDLDCPEPSNVVWPGTTKNTPLPDVLEILENHNFVITGDCYSERLIKIRENGRSKSYNILRVPIK